MTLLTPGDLAERFHISEPQVLILCRENRWPHVRLSRKAIRFTPEQVEQIVGLHSKTPKPAAETRAVIEGQTARSAARRRSA